MNSSDMHARARVMSAISASLVLLSSCVSFVPAHERFIRLMDGEVALHRTIEQYGFDPAYPLGGYLADEHYFTNMEVGEDGQLIYHYATPTLRMDMICHYHLIVDPKTRVVVGWGFDTEFGDPKKTCGNAG